MAQAPPIIIPAELDDADLTVYAFRILCHLARRGAGQNGAWGSIEGMADKMRIDPKTVKKSLRELIAKNWITRSPRPGLTSLYSLATQATTSPRPPDGPGYQTAQGVGHQMAQGVGHQMAHEGVTIRSQEKEDSPQPPQGGQDTGSAAPEQGRIDSHVSTQSALHAKKRKGARGARMEEPVFPDDLPRAYHGPLARWFGYKRQTGKGYVRDGWQALVTQQRKFPARQVAVSVENSMANNWAGLFTDRVAAEAQKNGGGAASVPLQVEYRAVLIPPEGYEHAMDALFGEGWETFCQSWPAMPPSDRAAVNQWLKNNNKISA